MMNRDYKRELEAWGDILTQAQRDVLFLALQDERRPRHLEDMISSLEGLIRRMRRQSSEE